MSKVFKGEGGRSNAKRAARVALGKAALFNVDFTVSGDATAGFTWAKVDTSGLDGLPNVEPTPAPAKPAKVAKAKKPANAKVVVKAKPVRKAKKVKAKGKKVAKKSLGGATVLRGKRLEFFNMIAHKGGESLENLCKKLGWQKHTVRGVVSTMNSDSKVGVHIASYKTEGRGRVYEIDGKAA